MTFHPTHATTVAREIQRDAVVSLRADAIISSRFPCMFCEHGRSARIRFGMFGTTARMQCDDCHARGPEIACARGSGHGAVRALAAWRRPVAASRQRSIPVSAIGDAVRS